MISIVYITNIMNHYQKALFDELHLHLGERFKVIITDQLDSERIKMGWSRDFQEEYLLDFNQIIEKNRIFDLIDSADVVILGHGPISFVDSRIKAGKLTFLAAERLFKQGYLKILHPKILARYYIKYTRYRNYKNFYLLCMSGYMSADSKVIRAFPGRALRWGYVAQKATRKIEELTRLKNQKDATTILWAGRLIKWKRPEHAIRTAAYLKSKGFDFTLTIVGSGPEESRLMEMVNKLHLSDCVTLAGSKPPEQVAELMEGADIYLFTSDYNEGWGVVLNEAMMAGCAVVASHAAGSTPCLLNNKRNGLIYNSGDIKDLFKKTEYLLRNKDVRMNLGKEGFKTVSQKWSAACFAERIIAFSEGWLAGYEKKFDDGPVSLAPILKNKWFGSKR